MGRTTRHRAGSSRALQEPWSAQYLQACNHGEKLLLAGRAAKAAEVFEGLLSLQDLPAYERAVVLGRMGHCLHVVGRNGRGEDLLREAIDIAAQLAKSDNVLRLRATLHAKLGDVLYDTGQYAGARQACEVALAISEDLEDLHGQAFAQGQLGTWAFVLGQLDEALVRWRASLVLFQQIGDSSFEAIAHQQLGQIFHKQRRWDEAEHHYQEAIRFREEKNDRAGTAQLCSQLALLGKEADRPEAAETWYRKAIEWYRQAGDSKQLVKHVVGLAALLREQPSRLAEARRLIDQALAAAQQTWDRAAPESWAIYGILADLIKMEAAATADGPRRVSLQSQASLYRQVQQYAPQFITALDWLGESSVRARAMLLGRLARCFEVTGRIELAKARLREALSHLSKLERTEDVEGLQGMLQAQLGDAHVVAGEYEDASEAYETALVISKGLNDLYGQGLAQNQLGAWAFTQGKLEEAVMRYRAASELFQKIDEPALESVAQQQLARIFQQKREWNEADRRYREAVRLHEAMGDLAGAAQLRNQLALLYKEAGRPEPSKEQYRDCTTMQSRETPLTVDATISRPVEITLHEEINTEYGLEPDLLLDGRRENRITRWTQQPKLLAESLRPMLMPCARTFPDENDAIRIALPQGEPRIERYPGCTMIRRLRREIAISGCPELVWRVIRMIDGSNSVSDILARLPPDDRSEGARLLALLAAVEAVDISGRPIGRFLHSVTKKGVLPAGGLKGDQVLNLATDASYRGYPKAPRIPLSLSVPEALRDFHALTRRRRSRRDYSGLGISRSDLEAMLNTACGVTGKRRCADREAKLRAYPSSGALYAVEIYPLVLHVEGLDPGVYHYRTTENVLEVVKAVIDKEAIIEAMLPMERQMVRGAAALICLTGNLPRHERKYGEGGYRMLIAEAGHISQNLVLAATALGLAARPFGGVFDSLLNRDLGLEEMEEPFLLSVLMGLGGNLRRPIGGSGGGA